MDARPYEIPALLLDPRLPADGGNAAYIAGDNSFAVFEIPHPTRVKLTKVLIRQQSGADSNFTADFFNNVVAVGDPAPAAVEIYRVAPQLVGAGGVLSKFYDAQDIDFYSQDTLTTIGQKRTIYLKLGVTGNVTGKTFKIVIGSREH